MKKISVLIIILLFVFVACIDSAKTSDNNTKKITDVEKDGLKGKVKEWVWLWYNIKDNEKSLTFNYTKKYDEKGNIIE